MARGFRYPWNGKNNKRVKNYFSRYVFIWVRNCLLPSQQQQRIWAFEHSIESEDWLWRSDFLLMKKIYRLPYYYFFRWVFRLSADTFISIIICQLKPNYKAAKYNIQNYSWKAIPKWKIVMKRHWKEICLFQEKYFIFAFLLFTLTNVNITTMSNYLKNEINSRIWKAKMPEFY